MYALNEHSPATLDVYRDTDVGKLVVWMNDLNEIALWSGRRKQLLRPDVIALLEQRSRNAVFTVIRHADTAEPIGFADASVNEAHGIAEFQVYIDRGWRHSRRALHGMASVVGYLFRSFPVRKLYCYSFEFNKHSEAVLRRGGFVNEGRFREFVWWQDRYADMLVWSISRQVWELGCRGAGPGARFARAAAVSLPQDDEFEPELSARVEALEPGATLQYRS